MAIVLIFLVQYTQAGVIQAVKPGVGTRALIQLAALNSAMAVHVAVHQARGHQLHAIPIKPVLPANA